MTQTDTEQTAEHVQCDSGTTTAEPALPAAPERMTHGDVGGVSCCVGRVTPVSRPLPTSAGASVRWPQDRSAPAPPPRTRIALIATPSSRMVRVGEDAHLKCFGSELLRRLSVRDTRTEGEGARGQYLAESVPVALFQLHQALQALRLQLH